MLCCEMGRSASSGHREVLPCAWAGTRQAEGQSKCRHVQPAAAWSCLDVLPPSLHVWPQHGRVGRCTPPPGQPEWPLTPLGKLQQETWVPSDRSRRWQKQLCSLTLGRHPRRTEGTLPPPSSPPVRASPVAGGHHVCVPSRPVSPRANAPVRVNPSVCMPLARAARSK